MQRIVKNFPSKTFEIIAGSCTHIGSIMCHRSGIEYAVDYIASRENCFFIHLGDWIEAICTDDKRYNAPPRSLQGMEEPIPLLQTKDAISLSARCQSVFDFKDCHSVLPGGPDC